MRGIIEIARKYETEWLEACKQSGIDDCVERVYLATVGLRKIVDEVAEIEPLTMAGVAIQARALCAYAEAETDYDKGHAKLILGLPVAQSIARLTQGGATA
jgi:hypothetical protein